MAGPILVLGAEGQVGWELQRSLALLGEVLPLGRAQADLADADGLRSVIRAAAPAAIVNAGAYTAVDKAESEQELAFAINAKAPGIMAEEAKAAGIPLIHFSTDYAYAGDKASPYIETDATGPQSTYGRSKLAGDKAILASGCRAVILRTSWVFAARGHNFIKTILRLGAERETLRVVDDQIGAPTSAELLADVCAHVLVAMQRGDADKGLYHCTAAGAVSWHGYAQFIVNEALALGRPLKLTATAIEAITTSQYPTPAKRPHNSRLDCSRLEQDFGLHMPPWQLHVSRTLKELIIP